MQPRQPLTTELRAQSSNRNNLVRNTNNQNIHTSNRTNLGAAIRLPPKQSLMNGLMQLNMIIDAYNDAGGEFILPDAVKVMKCFEKMEQKYLETYLKGSFNNNPNSDIYKKFTMKINNNDDTICHYIFKNVFEGNAKLSEKGSLSMLKYLIENYGNKVNIKANYTGMLPIHYLPNLLKPDIIELCIQCNVNLKMINEKTGQNLWHMIANKIYPLEIDPIIVQKSFDLLIRNGVKIGIKDFKNIKAKDAVLMHKNPVIINSMLIALNKEALRVFSWIIWLQKNKKINNKNVFNITILPPQCQYGILTYLIEDESKIGTTLNIKYSL